MPPRSLFHAEKNTRPLSEEQFGSLMAAIARAAHLDRNAKSDYALIRCSYLLGCKVSEIASIRWVDIEFLDDGGQIHLFGKGSKRRLVRVSSDTLALFEGLGRGEAEAYVFPSPRGKGHLTRQAIGDVCRKWGRAAGFHVHPHQLGTAMRRTPFSVELMFSLSKRRSETLRARRLAITSLAILGIAALCVLVDEILSAQ